MTLTTSATSAPVERRTAGASPARALMGPLLIAARDDDSARGALRIAELVARRDGVNAHVLTLVPPLPFTASLLTSVDAAALREGQQRKQLARVRQRVHQTVGRSAYFSSGVEVGSPTQAIARAADERGSQLILVGLAAHGSRERAASEDAALQVTRTAAVPVLAVPAPCEQLPSRALVAIDFSAASARAARAALPMLAPGGRVTLAHVAPDLDFQKIGREGLGEIYAEGVAALFRRLVPELSAPGDVEVETVILRGDPRRSLLELATSGDFDLVAVGSQTRPWADSQLAGSVSVALVRGAGCAVLIAPPPEMRQ
jgi:nucleotide-binding universal stress UspA family protein